MEINISSSFKKELSSYLKKLKEELNVEEVIFFGSRVCGNHLLDSDLDIIVISKSFEGMPFLQRMELLYRLWDGKHTLEQFPYTPSELKKFKRSKVVIFEALSKGIRVIL